MLHCYIMQALNKVFYISDRYFDSLFFASKPILNIPYFSLSETFHRKPNWVISECEFLMLF